VRFCIIGTKNESRRRRVAFPKDLLKHLPPKITKPLFTSRKDSTTKRMRKFLTDIGVKTGEDDERMLGPLHSFRHRAATKLRHAKVDAPLLDAIGGWGNGWALLTSGAFIYSFSGFFSSGTTRPRSGR